MIENQLIIVEGYRSPHHVMVDSLLRYEDKLRILEKWNQIYITKIKVFPEHSEALKNAQKEIIALVNELVKKQINVHGLELQLD